MSDPEARDPEPADDPGFERHIAIFFQDSTLWPVLIVLIAAWVTLVASALLFGLRERNPYALTALVILGWMSADIVYRSRRQRRLGLAGKVVLCLWAAAGAAALAASHLGIF